MRLLVALALFLACACARTPTDETPSGALSLFLEAMERSEWDGNARQDAFELLSREARTALEQRARTATALAGRTFQAWEMVPEGRFRLRFVPRTGGMREQIDGDHANVIVLGQGDGERAEVPLVREDGRWRVVVAVPPVRGE